ncbi:MAG: glycosyltransferase [Ignavibacteria bacterium]|nr:glycosyltransferase [Ignavibacteria bacterium]
MIYEIFQILLWVTAIMLFISGIDDLYLDVLYWLQRRKYKKKMPDFSEMFDKPEKPIAIFLGAWKESPVIGRTLSYAIRNLNYTNFRFFVGVYPNDPDTLRVVQEISRKDARVIPCVNSQNGPTTKADNLNCLFSGVGEYEKRYGQFEVILVHDAEDFIHPNSLKLYNFLLGYKGYHAVQIPVIPIKSSLGKLFHRTYCDAFAEVHTKDMIVRQAMGTFIPFAGTGMGFHRKTFNYLEKYNWDLETAKRHRSEMDDPFNVESKKDVIAEAETKFSEDDFVFSNDESQRSGIYINETSYHDDPFVSLNDDHVQPGSKKVPESIKGYTFMFLAMVLGWISFLIYTGNTEASQENMITDAQVIEKFNLAPSELKASELTNSVSANLEKEMNSSRIIKDGIISVSNGFSDEKYNVLYIKDKNDKFIIQESVWSSEEAAKSRVEVLNTTEYFNNKSIEIQDVNSNGALIYKVFISGYKSIDEARLDVAKIKKQVQ